MKINFKPEFAIGTPVQLKNEREDRLVVSYSILEGGAIEYNLRSKGIERDKLIGCEAESIEFVSNSSFDRTEKPAAPEINIETRFHHGDLVKLKGEESNPIMVVEQIVIYNRYVTYLCKWFTKETLIGHKWEFLENELEAVPTWKHNIPEPGEATDNQEIRKGDEEKPWKPVLEAYEASAVHDRVCPLCGNRGMVMVKFRIKEKDGFDLNMMCNECAKKIGMEVTV